MTGQKGTAAELEAARRRNCLRLLGFDSRRLQTSRNAEIAAFSAVVCHVLGGISRHPRDHDHAHWAGGHRLGGVPG